MYRESIYIKCFGVLMKRTTVIIFFALKVAFHELSILKLKP
jgi:hypothetical protein